MARLEKHALISIHNVIAGTLKNKAHDWQHPCITILATVATLCFSSTVQLHFTSATHENQKVADHTDNSPFFSGYSTSSSSAAATWLLSSILFLLAGNSSALLADDAMVVMLILFLRLQILVGVGL